MSEKRMTWVQCEERNPETYGTYRVLCIRRGQATEDDYLWNGGYWVTPKGSPSKGVRAWAEYAEAETGTEKRSQQAEEQAAAAERTGTESQGQQAEQGSGWVNLTERVPARPGEYEVRIIDAGRVLPDRLTWTGKAWTRKIGKNVMTYCVQEWKEEETEEEAPESRKTAAERTGTESRSLAAAQVGRALSLADYEARIHLYREQIGTGYIGIGRTLAEAKAAGVVPHGQWESWVTETTGLTIRQAQRCMQAAAEIRDGSALARLEMSKALALLSSGLEAETREELAERSLAEGGSVRKLQAEIARLKQAMETERADAGETVKQLKLKVVEQSGAVAEIRAKLSRALEERDSLTAQMHDTAEAYRQRLDEATGDAYRRGMAENVKAIEAETRKEFQGKLDFLAAEKRAAEQARKDLLDKIEDLKARSGAKWDEGYEAGRKDVEEIQAALERKAEELRRLEEETARIRTEQEERIRAEIREKQEAADARVAELEAELQAAEAREAKRAQELAALKRDKARAGMDAARGIRADGLDGMDLTAAVRTFIGAAGTLPQMGGQLASLEEKEREAIRIQVETVAKWVQDARAALGMVTADVTVM